MKKGDELNFYDVYPKTVSIYSRYPKVSTIVHFPFNFPLILIILMVMDQFKPIVS